MESGDPPSNWNTYSGSVLDSVADERPGGGGLNCIDTLYGASTLHGYSDLITLDSYGLYFLRGWIKRAAGTSIITLGAGISTTSPNRFSSGGVANSTWVEYGGIMTPVVQSGCYVQLFHYGGASGDKMRADDVSIRGLSMYQLVSQILDTGESNVIASVKYTNTTRVGDGGVVVGLDSKYTPQSYRVAFYTSGRNSVFLFDSVSGTWTQKVGASTSYLNGKTLLLVSSGTVSRVYYNDVFIGTQQTMAPNTNTSHGIFATHPNAFLQDFTVFSCGLGGEYSELDEF